MIKNNVLGIIFANSHDDLIPELTKKRSMASVPFGGRYRLIDFSLSNLVNAGISKVGIITKSNYNSLLDHLGSGISWDLDRKNGGLFMLPPFSTEKAGLFKGRVDALAGVMTFLKRSHEDYVVMCDSDVIGNIDIDNLITHHKKSGAGITIAYKHGVLPGIARNTMVINIGENEKVENISIPHEEIGECDYSLDIFVVKRELLIDIISAASKNSLTSLSKEIFIPKLSELNIKAYEIKEFAEIIHSKESYAEISMSLLNADKRRELFSRNRPIYTKTFDNMPTRYGVNSSAENSLIADGCVIEGKIKNSIIFRGVNVGKDAVIENCIIMQGTKIGNGCTLKNVIIDKAAVISDDTSLMGKKEKYIFVDKEKVI